MAKPLRLAPYPVSEKLELRLSDWDDPTRSEPLEVVEVDAPDRGAFGEFLQRTYNVVETDPEWSTLAFKLKASLPEGELSRVLPKTSDPAEDLTLLVSMACKKAKYRHGVTLEWMGEGKWVGDVSLRKRDVRGTVRLRPMLVRSTALPSPKAGGDAPGSPVKPGMMVAMGDPISLYVDEPQNLFETPIEVKWDKFATSDNTWRENHESDVFHLEPHGTLPTLTMNEGIDGLRRLLDSEGNDGPDAALRDITAVMVAQSVWLQLAVAAFGAVDFDEETGEAQLPMEAWQRDVVKTLLPRMYPRQDEGERLAHLGGDLNDRDGIKTVMERAGSAVQDLLRTYRYVEAALRARESLREVDS